jgi:hypothetical protein
MNAELIKKYEKEFLHHLYGGKVLFYSSHHGGWFNLHENYQWDDSIEITEKCNDYGYIINDKYVEYRKALAEGKAVEVYAIHDFKVIDEQPWRLFAIGCSTFDLPVECYRIKPEETRFKVGDWVRDGESLYPFVEPTSMHSYTESLKRCTKWEPKEGEVCIFWDAIDTGNVISKFSHMEQEKYSTARYAWNYCMPFKGILPPHIKDNK